MIYFKVVKCVKTLFGPLKWSAQFIFFWFSEIFFSGKINVDVDMTLALASLWNWYHENFYSCKLCSYKWLALALVAIWSWFHENFYTCKYCDYKWLTLALASLWNGFHETFYTCKICAYKLFSVPCKFWQLVCTDLKHRWKHTIKVDTFSPFLFVWPLPFLANSPYMYLFQTGIHTLKLCDPIANKVTS
jgi:hypothetical protein